MNVKVIDEWKAKEDAYDMGYERFESLSIPEQEEFEFAPFTDSAEYANRVLPKLRAMAGFDDAGHGTYQVDNQVVLVEYPDDEPADGTLIDTASMFFDDLVDCYRRGADDAVERRGRDPPHRPEMDDDASSSIPVTQSDPGDVWY